MNRETGRVIIGTMQRAWANQKWEQDERDTFLNAVKDLDDTCALEALSYCAKHEEFRPSIAKFRDHTLRIAHGHARGYQAEERTMSEKDITAAQFFGPRLTEITGSPVWGSISSATGARNQGDKVRGRTGGMFAGDPDEGALIKIACNNLIGEWIEICERHGWDYVDPRDPSER